RPPLRPPIRRRRRLLDVEPSRQQCLEQRPGGQLARPQWPERRTSPITSPVAGHHPVATSRTNRAQVTVRPLPSTLDPSAERSSTPAIATSPSRHYIWSLPPCQSRLRATMSAKA